MNSFRHILHKKFRLMLPFIMLAFGTLACDLESMMGTITVGSEPLPFTVHLAGEDHIWEVSVSPGRYEVLIVPSEEPHPDKWGANEISVSVNGVEDCNDCILSVDGTIVQEGVRLVFSVSDYRNIRIFAIFRGDTRNFTIQIREVDEN